MEPSVTKEFMKELKTEWKTLWWKRIDDNARGEAIADKDYGKLFVERGTVIFATRKFKMPSFKEILQLHGVIDTERIAGPHPSFGGWGKFIRKAITPQQRLRHGKRARQYCKDKKQKPQLKKGGRGWLHK